MDFTHRNSGVSLSRGMSDEELAQHIGFGVDFSFAHGGTEECLFWIARYYFLGDGWSCPAGVSDISHQIAYLTSGLVCVSVYQPQCVSDNSKIGSDKERVLLVGSYWTCLASGLDSVISDEACFGLFLLGFILNLVHYMLVQVHKALHHQVLVHIAHHMMLQVMFMLVLKLGQIANECCQLVKAVFNLGLDQHISVLMKNQLIVV